MPGDYDGRQRDLKSGQRHLEGNGFPGKGEQLHRIGLVPEPTEDQRHHPRPDLRELESTAVICFGDERASLDTDLGADDGEAEGVANDAADSTQAQGPFLRSGAHAEASDSDRNQPARVRAF